MLKKWIQLCEEPIYYKIKTAIFDYITEILTIFENKKIALYIFLDSVNNKSQNFTIKTKTSRYPINCTAIDRRLYIYVQFVQDLKDG